MQAHKIRAVMAPNGKLELSNLPFEAGSGVEVIILGESPITPISPLRGTYGEMRESFEAAVELIVWDVLNRGKRDVERRITSVHRAAFRTGKVVAARVTHARRLRSRV